MRILFCFAFFSDKGYISQIIKSFIIIELLLGYIPNLRADSSSQLVKGDQLLSQSMFSVPSMTSYIKVDLQNPAYHKPENNALSYLVLGSSVQSHV